MCVRVEIEMVGWKASSVGSVCIIHHFIHFDDRNVIPEMVFKGKITWKLEIFKDNN